MLVAVEASADTLGAGLARALKARLGDAVNFCGVGGARMAAEGVASPFDIAGLSLFGVFEIVTAIPRALGRIDETVRLAEHEQPDVAVLIDSWAFTSRVAQGMRRRTPGVKLIKYVAPQVWATRPGRARALARCVDYLMTLLAFEPPIFEAVGLRSAFVGNPTLARDATASDPARFRTAIGAGPDDPILLVLPGSRPSELKHILPVFEDAAMILKAARPKLHLVVAAAGPVADVVKARIAGWPERATVVEGDADKFDAMAAGTVALAKSGTVTSELAGAGCPMVVGYRVNPLTAIIARLIIQTEFATLFNIAAGRAVAPELIQGDCTGPKVAKAVSDLLDDPARRVAQAAAQSEALELLGAGVADPYGRAADVVLKVLDAG
jgi:lipid-A-disaccharide synthase